MAISWSASPVRHSPNPKGSRSPRKARGENPDGHNERSPAVKRVSPDGQRSVSRSPSPRRSNAYVSVWPHLWHINWTGKFWQIVYAGILHCRTDAAAMWHRFLKLVVFVSVWKRTYLKICLLATKYSVLNLITGQFWSLRIYLQNLELPLIGLIGISVLWFSFAFNLFFSFWLSLLVSFANMHFWLPYMSVNVISLYNGSCRGFCGCVPYGWLQDDLIML